MKSFAFLFILLMNCFISFSQNFEINSHILEKEIIRKTKDSIFYIYNDKPFYEDKNYFVEKYCKGEWGGVVIFTNKLSKEKFIYKSTCPVNIILFNKKYIVSNTLHHLGMQSTILQIKNPKHLKKKYKNENLKEMDFSKVSSKASKELLRTYKYSILGSFVRKNELYFLITNDKETSIAQIKNKEFKIMQKVCDKKLFSIRSTYYRLKNDKTYIPFSDHNNSGYILISNDEIELFFEK